jgi:glycosyltransferase involved in cell wall biosynthesis
MISIIMPAYNESAVIARTLASVSQSLGDLPGEIIVVCNGCVDDTYAIVNQFASQSGVPVTAIDLAEGSKIAALNAGDAAATGFPRFYLDADIELSPNAIRSVTQVLEAGVVHAAAPRMHCDMASASWPVQAFYRTWLHRPYHRHGHVGSGFVGISQVGRERFDRFPDIIADDEFVRRQFAADERQVVLDASFTIHVPRDIRSLIKVKTRSRLGTQQLEQRFPELTSNAQSSRSRNSNSETSDSDAMAGESTSSVDPKKQSSAPQVAQPSRLDQLAYACVVLCSRWRANRQFRTGKFGHWERDETSRV